MQTAKKRFCFLHCNHDQVSANQISSVLSIILKKFPHAFVSILFKKTVYLLFIR